MASYMNEMYTSHFWFCRILAITSIGVSETPNGSTITNEGSNCFFCSSSMFSHCGTALSNAEATTWTWHFDGSFRRSVRTNPSR